MYSEGQAKLLFSSTFAWHWWGWIHVSCCMAPLPRHPVTGRLWRSWREPSRGLPDSQGSRRTYTELEGLVCWRGACGVILATAHSSWSGKSKVNGAKLCHLVVDNTTRSGSQELPWEGSSCWLGKPMRGGTAALEHVTESGCAISTLGNFQGLARQTTAWQELVWEIPTVLRKRMD